jgi:hypothetical protein
MIRSKINFRLIEFDSIRIELNQIDFVTFNKKNPQNHQKVRVGGVANSYFIIIQFGKRFNFRYFHCMFTVFSDDQFEDLMSFKIKKSIATHYFLINLSIYIFVRYKQKSIQTRNDQETIT